MNDYPSDFPPWLEQELDTLYDTAIAAVADGTAAEREFNAGGLAMIRGIREDCRLRAIDEAESRRQTTEELLGRN